MKPKSQAQARFFGAVAGGRGGKAKTARNKGYGRLKAREDLRGVNTKALPPRSRSANVGTTDPAKKPRQK